MQNTEKIIIAIGVDTTTNEITYGGKKECHALVNEQVEWESEGPFAIQFLTTTPFTDSHFQSDSVGAGKHGKKRIVRSDAQSKTIHKYAVAVYLGGKVYLDPKCPVIIID